MEAQRKSLFIGATGQHVGKTTICLGLLSTLCQRFGAEEVGFIKPVGQKHLVVDGGQPVDKDAVLFREHFSLSCDYGDMSPVLVPAGFTRSYLDGEVDLGELKSAIQSSFGRITQKHRVTIVEGTGHVGVGSIIDLNNAQVAALLGIPMLIVAGGGLGSSFDELALNVGLCEKYGVPVQGVILNRVHESKMDMVKDYYQRALERWGIPLLGTVPYNEYLSTPCMRDFEVLFKTKMIAGREHLYRHFEQSRLVATTIDTYSSLICRKQLVITPARREDIILATIGAHYQAQEQGKDLEGGMILTGRHAPRPSMLREIKRSGLPILYAPLSSYNAMKLITSFTAKTRGGDVEKIRRAKELIEASLDLSILLGSPVQESSA
jgi:BioD-like phosphotransacetylase family protein